MSEFIELLTEFDLPQVVEAACRQMYEVSRYNTVPKMIVDAVRRGLLVALDGEGEVRETVGVYSRDLMLTDEGRRFCGIEVDEHEPSQRSLF